MVMKSNLIFSVLPLHLYHFQKKKVKASRNWTLYWRKEPYSVKQLYYLLYACINKKRGRIIKCVYIYRCIPYLTWTWRAELEDLSLLEGRLIATELVICFFILPNYVQIKREMATISLRERKRGGILLMSP